MTYDAWFDAYMSLYKRKVKPKTRESYDHLHAAFISPVLGALDLAAITPEHIQLVLLDAGGHGGRTAQITYALMHAVFRRALRSRLVAWSPVEAIDKPEHAASIGCALNDQAYEAVMPYVVEDVGLSLAVLAGLRRGEICGLQWQDVDLREGVLHVRRTRVRVNHQLITQSPKSAAGLRDVPILPELAALLRSAYQLKPRAWVYDLAPESLNRRWAAIQRAAQLPQPYRLHDLRHTFVTRLLLSGCNPRVVQYVAGHSSLDMTMRVYAHVTADDARREIASMMRRANAI